MRHALVEEERRLEERGAEIDAASASQHREKEAVEADLRGLEEGRMDLEVWYILYITCIF
jgi:hypothetical protein